MANVFRLPDVGEGIAEGTIVEWLVSEGETIEVDQPVVKVETDKAVVELPSPDAGVVLRLHAAVGETVAVGAPGVSGAAGAAGASPSAARAPEVNCSRRRLRNSGSGRTGATSRRASCTFRCPLSSSLSSRSFISTRPEAVPSVSPGPGSTVS